MVEWTRFHHRGSVKPGNSSKPEPIRRVLSRQGLLTAWVVFAVQFFQALASDVRIDLRCRQVAVPEQHLHDSKIGASVQQMRRESVA